MGNVFLHGGSGGASLNFKIIPYATEEALMAATPAENTIGVITEHKITSWIFSATEPADLEPGMLWIAIGTSSAIEFNALKKNSIQVYPVSARQYVAGKLVNRTAKSYRGGRWVDWVMYLYNNGDECLDVTGGWQALAVGLVGDGWGTLEPTLEKNADHMRIQMPYTDKTGIVATVNTIDLTRGTTLVASFECSIKNSDYDTTFIAVYQDGESPWSNPVAKLVLRDGDTSAEIDVSSLSGLYKICFGVTTNSLGFTDYTEIIVRSVCVK